MVNKLVAKLQRDFPDFKFVDSDTAHWSPTEQTIFYSNNLANLLHELGHAILNHKDFTQDIELLQIERDAWTKAREIAPNYDIEIDDETIETAMDAYRDWLHDRSLCPTCGQTGLQSVKNLDYYCVNCGQHWQANDARTCGLKRRKIK